jgi:hypothetical protein
LSAAYAVPGMAWARAISGAIDSANRAMIVTSAVARI